MTAVAVEAVARPQSRRRRLAPPGWPVYVFFVSLPAAWVLGLANFALVAYGFVILLGLLLRPSVRVPRGFGIWLLFLLWVAASALQLDGGDRVVAYAYRSSLYLTATALFVYIFTSSERDVPTRIVVKALTIYWAAAVVGGFLGMAFADVVLPSLARELLALVLPASLINVGFIHDITTPGFAEVQRILGFPVGRPKTFFNYTNEWGSTVVLLTPFALMGLRFFGRVWRRVITALLLLSVVPLVVSLNRGAWIALVVLVVYASVRFALAGNVRALRAVLVVVAVAAAVTLMTPLSGLIVSRIHHGHSDEGRETRNAAAIELAEESPFLGHGAPQPTETDPTAPAVGTHGQAFLLLVSQGFPGFALFFGWFLYSLFKSGTGGSHIRFWCHVVIIVFLVQTPFYELTSFQLVVVAAAAALAWREIVASGDTRGRRPRWAIARVDAAATSPAEVTSRLAAAVQSVARLPRRPSVDQTRDPQPPVQGVEDARSGAAQVQRRDLSDVARGGALGIVGGVCLGVLGFVLLLVVSQGLGATAAGVFFEAVALFAILTRITQIGADVGVVRALSALRALGHSEDIGRTLVVAVAPVAILGAVAGFALYVFAPDMSELVVNGTPPDSLVEYIRIWSPFLVLAALTGVLLAAARGLGSLVPFVSVENIGKPALQPLLIFVVLALGLGTTAVALSWAVPVAIGFGAATWWLAALVRRATIGQATRFPSPTSTVAVFSDFWRFSAPRAVAAFFQATVAWLDVLLVGALASTRAAGIYAAASRLALLGALFLRALILVLGPQVSAFLARGERERAQVVYQVSTWWLTALAWPLYILLAMFAPVVLEAFGAEFVAGDTALVVLSLAMLISMACGPVSVVLLMAGKSSWNLFNTILSAALGVGLNIVLIPRYGIVGAAVAGAVAIAANNLIPLAQVWRFLRLHPLGAGFLIVACDAWLAYGVIGLLGRLAFGATPVVLVGTCVLATVGYALLLWRARDTLRLDVLREIARSRTRRAPAGAGVAP